VLCHFLALVPRNRTSQLLGELDDLDGEGLGDDIGGVAIPKLDQHHEPGLALDERGDDTWALAVEQVAFRKGVDRPGGSGVAEVALRFGR
jgi:hypothetical protein